MKRNDASSVLIAGDSRLVINQMTGVWSRNDEKLSVIKDKATHLLTGCHVEYRWIRRNQNERADELSKIGLEKNPAEPQKLERIENAKRKELPIEVIYHAGLGFSVIEANSLYAVNLNPEVTCSCGSDKTRCRHISAA